MNNLKEVSKEEMYNFIADKDAIFQIVSNYPYYIEWNLRGKREVIAKSIPHGEQIGIPDDKSKYFITP
jgi:hypothetical protein